ncbi:MAG: phenylalanine--tRNA ligase subunit beta [Candidatus Paceibacterota bacterium]
MKISRDWLQTFFETPLPESAAIAEALTFHAFEIEGIENDVLDVKVTPNRGHDCLSHRGIARELAAILQLNMILDPLRVDPTLAPVTEAVSISIGEPSLCKRYIAGYIRGVKVAPSPAWLQKALESVGQRSINNVVDATNYVMFHLGQPLHAFDAGMLGNIKDGPLYSIQVRKARDGEKMVALDGKEYQFNDSALLITDAHTDKAIGIAGVKGGAPASITEATSDIIIESANFDGVSVRKTAQALKLRTDASSRFEQGISPEIAAYGMHAVADLILSLAGGELVGFSDRYPVAAEKLSARASTAHINATLGTQFQDADVSGVFTRLDLAHMQEGGIFDIHVPFERLDISIPEDLAEEVARIAGYEHIPSLELAPMPEKPAVQKNFFYQERVREFLVAQGFSEIFTPVFTAEGEEAVLNKVESDTPYVRRDLLGGLRAALDKNVRNKDLFGVTQVKLFEIGTVWRDGGESVWLGVAVEKVKKQGTALDSLRALGEHLGVSIADTLPDEVLEIPIGELISPMPDPEAYEPLPMISDVRYQTFSRYPFIVRDIALWTGAGTKPEAVLETIRSASGSLLVRISLFDQFEKEGKVSYAFRLVFQSFDKTLTDGDANERMESVNSAVAAKGWQVR